MGHDMDSKFSPFPSDKNLRCSRYLGTLQDIIIYPLDGGYQLHLSDAFCLAGGLVSLSGLLDRSLIAYTRYNKEAIILNVHKPELDIIENLKLINEVEYLPNKDLRRIPIVIDYLGKSMALHDIGNRVASVAESIFGISNVRIAYCSPRDRRKFDTSRNALPNSTNLCSVDNLSSYHSNYTLVNSSSLKDLEMKIGTYTEPSVFRANLVIDGLKPYIEDDPNITCLQIGSNMFSKLLPCTRSPDGFLNQANIPIDKKLEAYNILKRYRNLKDLRPEFNKYNNPTVGINMSLISGEGQIIQIGDVVTAHYIPDL